MEKEDLYHQQIFLAYSMSNSHTEWLIENSQTSFSLVNKFTSSETHMQQNFSKWNTQENKKSFYGIASKFFLHRTKTMTMMMMMRNECIGIKKSQKFCTHINTLSCKKIKLEQKKRSKEGRKFCWGEVCEDEILQLTSVTLWICVYIKYMFGDITQCGIKNFSPLSLTRELHFEIPSIFN